MSNKPLTSVRHGRIARVHVYGDARPDPRVPRPRHRPHPVHKVHLGPPLRHLEGPPPQLVGVRPPRLVPAVPEERVPLVGGEGAVADGGAEAVQPGAMVGLAGHWREG